MAQDVAFYLFIIFLSQNHKVHSQDAGASFALNGFRNLKIKSKPTECKGDIKVLTIK